MATSAIPISSSIGVIDIFAGPGGLGEGFSSFESVPGSGLNPFKLSVSAEMESSAHATLRLRAFFRLLREREGEQPTSYDRYLRAHADGKALPPEMYFGAGPLNALWSEAEAEALNLTLGLPEHNRALYDRIEIAKRKHDRLVLVGGPPCQAYSLVGRSRQANVLNFRTHGDDRHFLYREYLGILARFSPDVFIMENVKGILTSTVGGKSMFARIRQDLSDPVRAIRSRQRSNHLASKYVLLPVHVGGAASRSSADVAAEPSGFIVRCENHGAPQARHRVILMGVRADLVARGLKAPSLDLPPAQVSVSEAFAGLPKLRSGLSRSADNGQRWADAVRVQCTRTARSLGKSESALRERLDAISPDERLPRSATCYNGLMSPYSSLLRTKHSNVVLNHETRGHMEKDLGRYLFCSTFALEYGRSPTSHDFPDKLAPKHANWNSGCFADRFKVQVKGKPSSTVTSHLSKDGHAFIHWDPAQCRSLTVREAARLQTFPDDYLFLGNRTQQFVQVGNAVPPLIAGQIARTVWSIVK